MNTEVNRSEYRPPARAVTEESARAAIEPIRAALAGLRYGVVTITVQDGVVVQIDRTDRQRLR
jgi:hypothetical protein